LKRKPARWPARSTMRATPAVVNGAARSDVNTNGGGGSCSRFSRRRNGSMGCRRSHTAIPLVTVGHDRRLSLPTPDWGAERIGSGNEGFHQAILGSGSQARDRTTGSRRRVIALSTMRTRRSAERSRTTTSRCPRAGEKYGQRGFGSGAGRGLKRAEQTNRILYPRVNLNVVYLLCLVRS
jgi:hypothetical protein